MFSFVNDRRYFRSREPKNPASKSTKRLVESQKLAETRQAGTRKYQHATQQRAEALRKNALEKAENAARDDPHVSEGYDLWNQSNAKKGKEKAKNFNGGYSKMIHRKNSSSRWF